MLALLEEPFIEWSDLEYVDEYLDDLPPIAHVSDYTYEVVQEEDYEAPLKEIIVSPCTFVHIKWINLDKEFQTEWRYVERGFA